MTLIAIVSAKGSPGASTAGLAFTLTWPAPVLLAECDPAGGDLLAGYLARYELPANRGVLPLASAALRGTAEQELAGNLIDLDAPRQQRMALPGLTEPGQSATLNMAWTSLGEFFARMTAQMVIADCGRLSAAHPPWGLLARADLVLLALRPHSLRTVSPAVSAVTAMRRQLPAGFVENNLGLLLIGGGIAGREVSRHLGVPVAASLPWDPPTAGALCGDGRGRRRAALMRKSAAAYENITALIASRRMDSALSRRDTEPLLPVLP
ncbi:ParA family protein [Catellatospora vulcania]|uniref:ParA family protein n=1 Tax=Catellatospora vulcania TaxID=1460450 RepID=UPI0012D3C7A3|nr:ParA family protein [Catellatospora vulcania]